MDFFPEPPPRPPVEEPREPVLPDWDGPPQDLLPGVVPVELVLGRSDDTAVLLLGIRAFPTGLFMTLGLRMRGTGLRTLHDDLFDEAPEPGADPDWPRQRLKWGIELADGRRATSVDSPWTADARPDDPAWQPYRPLLRGGGGSSGLWTAARDYWLWPLPPPGRLRIVCEWPARGVERSVHDLDAGPFRAAAERARPIWPD